MRTRTFTLLTVLALVVAACGGDGDTTETTDDANSTSAAPEAVLLSYSLSAGDAYTYEVDMDQTISMNIQGDPTAIAEAEDEEVPEQMDLHVTGTTTFTHAVADGPEEGTYEITITGDFSDLTFEGTVDGEPIPNDGEDIPDVAGMEPVDVTIVVDEQGNVITDQGGMAEDFFGGMGGLDMLGQLGPGAGFGQFIGPPFNGEEVTVGDTWSETTEIPTLPEEDPISTTIESEVVAVDEIDGAEVFVIETATSTPDIDFDLADFLVGFMTAFVPEDASDEDLAEIEALTEQLRFAIAVDAQTTDMTTWFDHREGLARQANIVNSTHMTMDINIPDDTTGELNEMAMDMSIDQDITYRLVTAESA